MFIYTDWRDPTERQNLIMQRREPNTMKSLSWQRWQRPVHRGVGLKISRDGSSITQKERLRTCVQMQESWLVWSEKMKKLCSACFYVLNEMRLLVEYEEGRKEVWNRLHAAWLSSFSPPFAMQWKIPYSSIFWILLTVIYPFFLKSEEIGLYNKVPCYTEHIKLTFLLVK